jgi:hypothetical protein
MCNINGLKDHSTRHQMDVSDQCKTYRKSQELPLGTFAFRILLKRRGLSLSEFGVRMSQLSPGLLMSVHRTIQTYGPNTRFAISSPIVLAWPMDASPVVVIQHHHLGTSMPSGGVHTIKVAPAATSDDLSL